MPLLSAFSGLSIEAAGVVGPRIVRESLSCLKIATAVVAPPGCVAPSPSRVVRPPASSLCVPVLVLKSQTVVTLAPATVKTSLIVVSLIVAALVVVVALVVVALVVVVALIVVALVEV